MEKRNVYLDSSATTKVREEVLKEMLPYFTDVYGNASSVHTYGQQSKAALTKARETFAKLINAYWQSLAEEEKQQVKGILE